MEHDHTKRGTKRKRGGNEKDPEAKLTAKLHHCLKEVTKATKKAKTFEVQKLIKTIKSNNEDVKKVVDFEGELNALKILRHEPIAATALRNKLKKDHRLAANTDLQVAVASQLSSNPSLLSPPRGLETQITNRLLSSKVLSAATKAAIESLRVLIEPETKISPKKTNMEDQHPTGDEPNLSDASVSGASAVGINNHVGASDDGLIQDDKSTSDREGIESDGWESGSVDGGNPHQVHNGSGYSSASSESDEPVPVASDSEDEAIRPPKLPKRKPTVTGAESTFLPSLAVGFVRGDSDSEWSDNEADVADGGKKKNRRGQRARRAIWEKKFGRNANHVKKTDQATDRPTSGRGRGAHKRVPPFHDQDRNNGLPGRLPRPPQHFGNEKSDSRSTFRPPRQESQGVGSQGASRSLPAPQQPALHPSWEAKRKLKERESAVVRPQGTKIKF